MFRIRIHATTITDIVYAGVLTVLTLPSSTVYTLKCIALYHQVRMVARRVSLPQLIISSYLEHLNSDTWLKGERGLRPNHNTTQKKEWGALHVRLSPRGKYGPITQLQARIRTSLSAPDPGGPLNQELHG